LVAKIGNTFETTKEKARFLRLACYSEVGIIASDSGETNFMS
jgi:hypothetical protein